MNNVTIRMDMNMIHALNEKSAGVGISQTELVRIAISSFLAKESALTEYLDAIEILDEKISRMLKRQELFSRAIGAAALTPEQFRNQEMNGKLSDKMNQIVDSTN